MTTATTTRAAVDAPWPTYAQNAQRTGVATDQTTFTGIGLDWEQSLDGAVYGQPLLFNGAVYVATENNPVYAFDALTGSAKWQRSMGTPPNRATLAPAATNGWWTSTRSPASLVH